MRPTSPRAPRKVVFMKAHMREDVEWVEVGIGNLSATGLMVKHRRPPLVGAEVEIVHRGVRISGCVAWVAGSRFGVQSTAPIDVNALLAGSHLAQRTTVLAPERRRIWHWRKRG